MNLNKIVAIGAATVASSYFIQIFSVRYSLCEKQIL